MIGEKGFLMEHGEKNLTRFKFFFHLSFGGIFIFAFFLTVNLLNEFWHFF